MIDFYDRAPFSQLIYGNWDTAVEEQATQLSTIICDRWSKEVESILDVSYGIGTQAEEERQSGTAQTRVMRSRYYALSSNHSMQ